VYCGADYKEDEEDGGNRVVEGCRWRASNACCCWSVGRMLSLLDVS
jgi:hypothetical protein